MANKYNRGSVSVSSTRFTKAPMGDIEFSRMYAEPSHTTTMNAGDFVPIYCAEVLPHDTFSIDIDEVIRQATLEVPSMDKAIIDIFAYFVPNRIVNKSWKNVMGENTNGIWAGSDISLAPLYDSMSAPVKIPVGSVADYYGFPTQQAIPASILASCHDLKFRGYLDIYNNYVRDQNYQPPIPFSKLNVYNGFLAITDARIPYAVPYVAAEQLTPDTVPDGSVGAGAIAKELLGADGAFFDGTTNLPKRYNGVWRAYMTPLKMNKLHDYFTSVLPSPQKGEQVIIGVGGTAPVRLDTTSATYAFDSGISLRINNRTRDTGSVVALFNTSGNTQNSYLASTTGIPTTEVSAIPFDGWNVTATADLSQATGVSINDLRQSIAIQQVYEILGRGGSRYTEYINSFFGLDIDNPFDDIPTCLGHIRRDLDLYQTAQTSASTEGSPQGKLAAFGYTSTGGKLFTRTFLEHGYIHIMACIRHKNIYPSLLGRDNFRLNMMDFYQYPMANISEQPVYTREINPFLAANANTQVFGYQEAWAEYRMEPDRVSGYIRPGVELSLDVWSYADPFDSSLVIADGDFMESNTKEIIARGTSSDEQSAPQFKCKFTFKITKERPMPTYSMAGLDIL